MILRTAVPYAQYGERGTALIKRISKSLRLKLFFSVLISLAIAVAVFGLMFLFGNILLDKTVFGNAFSKKTVDEQFSELQKYVYEEDVTSGNLQKLNVWCSRSKKMHLTIYEEDELIFQSVYIGSADKELMGQEFDLSLEDPKYEYVLTLDDGKSVRTFLYSYVGGIYFFWMTVLPAIIAFVTFSFCFVVLINKKVSYVGQLKNELDILSGGQLDYPVTVNGNDELGELALGIDQMRRSIIKHQEIENQMRSSNSELITAMSHDLRTPLTSLLAYLEILQREKYTDEEQMRTLIHKSVTQTMRIKNMADKLFEYFLAYATEWESADMETVDADQFFKQILGDYAYSLENEGLTAVTAFPHIEVKVKVNPELFQRAFDNLYSNLLKYADKSEAVSISYENSDGFISVSISNKILADIKNVDSTSIGLITCRRIIEYHGGRFNAGENGDTFNVTVSIPVAEKT